MSEYVFRYANGYGFDAGDVEVVEYFAEENTDHYGTLHEEIVRCRDCKHSSQDGEECWFFTHKEEVNYGRWADVPAWVEPDGFCAWAVKRSEAENG